jgi:hypothetical protein
MVESINPSKEMNFNHLMGSPLSETKELRLGNPHYAATTLKCPSFLESLL